MTAQSKSEEALHTLVGHRQPKDNLAVSNSRASKPGIVCAQPWHVVPWASPRVDRETLPSGQKRLPSSIMHIRAVALESGLSNGVQVVNPDVQHVLACTHARKVL